MEQKFKKYVAVAKDIIQMKNWWNLLARTVTEITVRRLMGASTEKF